MEHLSRVRTANYGISTMDSPEIPPEESEPAFVVEKPHFVLCGLPVGSKEIDHHLYVNETRVGSYKTSAQALYRARREPRSGKAVSEILFSSSPDKGVINPSPGLPEMEGGMTYRAVPPIPPTTPVNYAHFAAMKAKSAANRSSDCAKFHGSIPDSEHPYIPSDGPIKQKKMTLLSRERSSDVIDLHRDHSSISAPSIRSVETVSESVVTNSLTVTTGKGVRLMGSGKAPPKVNYNNPYRNTKYKERLVLNGNKRMEFNSIDKYMKFQKQQSLNGKFFMTPRAILRIPKPCSDTFLLQMMYDLNRPKSRKSAGSVKQSDVYRDRVFEEFVHTRTSSSLSKAQTNIDKFMGKQQKDTNVARSEKSVKSAKSMKSAKSLTETITEEITLDDDIDDSENFDRSDG
ncbi:uncharacterized protein LOC128239066 isoform X2 [Mya arenaria]|nr:uncharacterized protein LOC128239066 isoform X2 [Mya arenaria]